MSPKPKGIVPPINAKRILKALESRSRGQLELESAVAEALNAGASVREVATLSGLSTTTIQKYKKARGEYVQ